ncbi:hypothetical protein J6590_067288 [Homalodisca vitripennis]|nr:hypothetical protein J6590_067288 [Homalodisca vitripennis]
MADVLVFPLAERLSESTVTAEANRRSDSPTISCNNGLGFLNTAPSQLMLPSLLAVWGPATAGLTLICISDHFVTPLQPDQLLFTKLNGVDLVISSCQVCSDIRVQPRPA